jgi:small ligand-binding sensory domain FIST
VPFAAALSEHPLATHATGEVVGTLLEALGPEPDLALIFVTGAHLGALDDIAAAVRATLAPRTLLGVTAVSVLGGGREVEGHAAVSGWAARVGSAEAVRIGVRPGTGRAGADPIEFIGLPESAARPGSTLVVLADPASFPLDPFLDGLSRQLPHLRVIGGVASAVMAPGANRLALDGAVYTDGAIGALLGPDWPVSTIVSQGCRPVGDPFTVTRAERSTLYEIAGTPALDKLRQIVAGLSVDDRTLASSGLHLGRLIDEHQLDAGRGDFLIRNVRGGDPGTGAIVVGDEIEVGATVQFQVRDADSADEDLRHLLAGTAAEGALVFTCNGRGVRLFGDPDHDASLVADMVGSAVAGMFCAGEVGPIGGRSFVHGLTASIALFADRRS